MTTLLVQQSPADKAESWAPAKGVGRRREHPHSSDVRAIAYALFSRLLASPFEQDEESLEEFYGEGLPDLLGEVAGALPFAFQFNPLLPLLSRVTPQDWPDLRRQYSSLFEVGEDGPPVPLRAELVRASETKMKEELVRFYDYFSYDLKEECAWAPDHISILLEFMQLLCLKEAEAESDESVDSFARAQCDFLDRHIASWLPVSIGKLVQRKSEGLYTEVLTLLWDFLEKDRAWNASTVSMLEGER